jgi:hypothetical protein
MVLNFMGSPALTATEAIARASLIAAKSGRFSLDLDALPSVGLTTLARAGEDAAIVAAGRQEFKRGPGNAATRCRGCGIRLLSGVDRDSRGSLRIIRRSGGAALKYRP